MATLPSPTPFRRPHPARPRFRPSILLAFLLVVPLACTTSRPTTEPDDDVTVVETTMTEPVSADGPSVGDTYVERIPGTDVTFTMTYIPGGTFTLGTPEGEAGREGDEGPQRTITIDPFWMSTTEVTYDMFALYRYPELDSDTSATDDAYSPDAVTRPSPPYEDPAFGMGKQGHPAVGMTQYGALKFARWLSEKTGAFYRLPTEAEWEHACRAGTSTAYFFGDDPAQLDAYAWYFGNSDDAYHPVGQKQPNPWGLYDILGNVSEWTLDQYDAVYYATLDPDAVNPWAQPTKLHPRTVRGGAYDDDPEALRCGARLESTLDWKRRDPQLPKSMWWNTDSPFLGFRLVRPARDMTPEEIEDFWFYSLNE